MGGCSSEDDPEYTSPFMTRIFNRHANNKLHQDQAESFQSMKVAKQYTEEELSLLLEKTFEGQFKQKTEMFESRIEQLLGEERDARLMTEEAARTEQTRSNEEIEDLRSS
ncbi:hypothetical protein L2E82_07761 [Cichorium intybus]|uniref:Uncharacterized protein n=1 Tax=Cichorium intybus TaxID=13427 RepID=A0ACB9G4J2_CICIN|nr:hypothetical protein L2E82_07761 [Cichorium intybus]